MTMTRETNVSRDCPRCECTHNCQLGDNPDWLAFLWQFFAVIEHKTKVMQALFIFTVSVNLRQQCFIFASYFEFIAAKTGRPVLIPGGICNAMHCSGYVSYFKFWVLVPLAGCCSFPVGGAIWQVYCRRGRGRHWQISLLCFFKVLCTALFYFSVLRFHISHQRTQVYCCIVREGGRSLHPPLLTFCLSIHAYTHPNPCLYLYFSILLL